MFKCTIKECLRIAEPSVLKTCLFKKSKNRIVEFENHNTKSVHDILSRQLYQ